MGPEGHRQIRNDHHHADRHEPPTRSEQTVKVGLRVTDSNGGWGSTTQELKVGNFPPVAHVAVSPSAPLTGQKVTLNASGSTDQGTITDYKWDLERQRRIHDRHRHHADGLDATSRPPGSTTWAWS